MSLFALRFAFHNWASRAEPSKGWILQGARVLSNPDQTRMSDSRPTVGVDEVLGRLGLPRDPLVRNVFVAAVEETAAEDLPHYSRALQRAHRAAKAWMQEREDFRNRLRRVLPELSPREQSVVTRRFGLDGGGPQSQISVSRALGISAATVRRVERRAAALLAEASPPSSAIP
jgi:DNA-directed RNA polymerase specialized sigma24 family protein